MEYIKRLDDKYLVIKLDDLDNYFSQFKDGIFTSDNELRINDLIRFRAVRDGVAKKREAQGKSKNHYVVLNMSDEIDLCDLIHRLYEKHKSMGETNECYVKNIATDIINAILCVKDI